VLGLLVERVETKLALQADSRSDPVEVCGI
jgi:hypothetical protein